MSRGIEKVFNKFGKYVVQQSRSNLTKQKKKDRGKLYNSISYELDVFPNSFAWSFNMEDYGAYVDKGVKGKMSSQKAPQSPYKFGTGTGKKGGLTKGINEWVKRKRFQFRGKDGKFWSYAKTSFVIIRSIYNTGLETTNFYSKPFETAFKKLPDDILEAYGNDLDEFLKFSL